MWLISPRRLLFVIVRFSSSNGGVGLSMPYSLVLHSVKKSFHVDNIMFESAFDCQEKGYDQIHYLFYCFTISFL